MSPLNPPENTYGENPLQLRITELEAELKTAQAFSHWVVIERDKLRIANTRLKAALTWAFSNISGDFDAQDTESQNIMYRECQSSLEAGE